MDSLRGQDQVDGDEDYDYDAIEAPPAIDTQERRMHVRAYNYWVSLLGNRCLPSIEDLNPEDMEDFSGNSVLLDFSMGLENPAILYLGAALRQECDITGPIERIAEVPPRSLLSRLTDHYLQIIANAAPVGFEAEFINQRGANIMYRGILMPFSSDDETIDFIYGVINWKETASESMSEQLGEEVKAALTAGSASYPATSIWADGPSATSDFVDEDENGFDELMQDGDDGDVPAGPADVFDLTQVAEGSTPVLAQESEDASDSDDALSFDELDLGEFLAAEDDDMLADVLAELEADPDEMQKERAVVFAPVADEETAGDGLTADASEGDPALVSALDVARRSAVEVRECEVRGHAALYRAIGHAYDFALTARSAPDAYAALLATVGITVQLRSQMTAVIKLVFGAEYEKTRVAEYALALDYAMINGLPRGALAQELASHQGGLKGLVQDMRAARKMDDPDEKPDAVRRLDRAVRKLGQANPVAATDLPFGDTGLAVVIARREEDGSITLVAGVDLQEKAAQKVMIAASKAI